VQVTYDFFAAAAVAFALYGVSSMQPAASQRRDATTQPKEPRRFTAGRLISFVALISYPFYLFHWPVLMAAVDLVGNRLAGRSGSAVFALAIAGITLVATIAVAIVAQVVVDRVVGTLRDRYASRDRVPPVLALETVTGEIFPAELVAPEIATERA
jgi:peptidoglycan/LPS O-acetylase OafA/YrhL